MYLHDKFITGNHYHEGHVNVCTKCDGKPSKCWGEIAIKTSRGARGRVWGSTKSSRSEKTSVPSFVPGHLVSVEAFHGIDKQSDQRVVLLNQEITKAISISPLGTVNICTSFHDSIWKLSIHYTKNQKRRPHGGAWGTQTGPPKSPEFILWRSSMSVHKCN